MPQRTPPMSQELGPIDITDNPQLRALAEEVRATGRSRTLVRDDEPVAVLTPPASTRGTRRGRRRAADPIGFLRDIIGLGTAGDGATDVSANKYRYLAEAYQPKKEG
jgi:hypothetical protein